MIGAVYFLH